MWSPLLSDITVKPTHVVTSKHDITVKPAHVVTSIKWHYSQACPCGHHYLTKHDISQACPCGHLYLTKHDITVKSAHVVTSIKQSLVLKGHIFLVLSQKLSYELKLY